MCQTFTIITIKEIKVMNLRIGKAEFMGMDGGQKKKWEKQCDFI